MNKKRNTDTDNQPVHASMSLKEALFKAESLLNNNAGRDIIELLIPLKEIAEYEPPPVQAFYNRLLAFGNIHQQNYTEAEKICQEGLKRNKKELDFYFIQTYVYLNLREYPQAIETYQQFQEHHNPDNPDTTQISVSEGYLSQLENFIGSAYMELGENEKAINCFQKSVQYDQGNYLPYLNIVNLYKRDEKTDKVQEWLTRGLQHCRQVQELRMLESTIVSNTSVSACMIVKNEEEMLPECLDSIRDWVDEIIIVDTGSTDKTVEIAESYGAKLFHQPWEGNFSKHRNYSIQQATSDWIFIIDADERMYQEDIARLRSLMNQDDINIISINVYNVYGKREETTTFLPSVRLWRKNIGLHYEGIVHNLLNLGMEHPVVRANVRLKHLGYDLSPEKMKQKFERTQALLEKQLEDNPDNAFALFNYAQLLKGDKSRGTDYPTHNIPAIKKAAGRAVEITDPKNKRERHIHLMCLDQLAWASFYDEAYDDAERYMNQALTLKPDYLDPLLLAGHLYARQERWEEAKTGYQRYLDTAKQYNADIETDPLILAHINSEASAYYSLGLIAEREADTKLAKEYYLQALAVDSGFIETNNRLAQLYAHENDFANAKKYFTRQLELSKETPEALLGLALIYQHEQNYNLADSYFKKAINNNQFDAQPKIKYAQFLINLNREKEAEEILEKTTLSGTEVVSVKQMLAETYFSSGKYKKAAEIYEKLSGENTTNAELWNDFANCYFKMKQLDKAIPLYEKAIILDPSSAIITRNLGLAYAGEGKYEAAKEQLESYIQLEPNDLGVMSILGEICFETGDYQAALGYLEEYLRSQPNDYRVITLLSDCYLHMGHRDSAMFGYRKVLELQPDYQPVIDRIAELEQIVNTLET